MNNAGSILDIVRLLHGRTWMFLGEKERKKEILPKKNPDLVWKIGAMVAFICVGKGL